MVWCLLCGVAGQDIAIVDRFSGRILEGRKYSDGLQQSIQVHTHSIVHSLTDSLRRGLGLVWRDIGSHPHLAG